MFLSKMKNSSLLVNISPFAESNLSRHRLFGVLLSTANSDHRMKVINYSLFNKREKLYIYIKTKNRKSKIVQRSRDDWSV